MKDTDGGIVLKASFQKSGEIKTGHMICFRIPAGQEDELDRLIDLKGERLHLAIVTAEEYEMITGERH